MLKEAWDSFKDNIRERVSNPFLGTFVLVWVVHNWKIVYAFFYFDKDWKLQQKIGYFKNYWIENNFIWNLICTSLITIGVLIVTYFFLAISRYLANFFENVIIPYVQKISKGRIVTIETHNSVLEKMTLLEGKIESERKAKNEAIQERDDFEKKLYKKDEPSENDENKKLYPSTNVRDVVNEAREKYGDKKIEKTLLDISKGQSFSEEEVIDFLLKFGVINFDKLNRYNQNLYNFTDFGNEFKREYFTL